MTPNETLQVLKKAGKPIVRSHFYRLTSLLKIRPLGHSRPQQYPADTAAKILKHLGVISDEEYFGYVQDCQAGHAKIYAKPAGKLISVRTLRAARPKKQTNKK